MIEAASISRATKPRAGKPPTDLADVVLPNGGVDTSECNVPGGTTPRPFRSVELQTTPASIARSDRASAKIQCDQNLSSLHVLNYNAETMAMLRYYFDVSDGETTFEDELGMDLLHADAVAGEAFGLLRDLVHDKLPEGRRVLTVRVRNGSGVLVYRGEMVVDGKRYPL